MHVIHTGLGQYACNDEWRGRDMLKNKLVDLVDIGDEIEGRVKVKNPVSTSEDKA